MRFTETINGYNAMGREDAEYEACYAIAEHHTVGGLHCHDFYEFYIHYQGGKVYYVDGSVFPLQNNQLIIMPPFRMHGLVGGMFAAELRARLPVSAPGNAAKAWLRAD